MYMFGPGSLYGVNSAANSTPRRFGGLQDCSVEFSFTVKELYGSYQFPLAIARGQGKVNCKAKVASINGGTFNDLFFNQTMATTGFVHTAQDEAGVIPATPFAITVANGATWVTDLGVIDVLTGLAMKKVASAPATGQYSVAAGGVYTFAAADTTKAVRINYTYTTAVAGPQQMTITNQLIGTTPLFQAVFISTYASKSATFVLNRCTSAKLGFASKLDDYNIPEFDFSAFADDSGNIGTLTFAD